MVLVTQKARTDLKPRLPSSLCKPSLRTYFDWKDSWNEDYAKRPALLDLFAGGGGAAMGYYLAGFRVVGVDIKPQAHYPFPFLQMDALEAMDRLLRGEGLTFSNGETLYLKDFDAYHASPPCQFASVMRKGRWQDREHPNLIPATRERLKATGKPYIIENVSGAKTCLENPILLCGTMFQLGIKSGNQLRRHRYFECPGLFILTHPCQHNKGSAIGVYGGGQHPLRRKPITIGVWGNAGGSSKRDGLIQFGTEARREAMGIDWMTGKELSQAIPPDYTKYIGKYLMQEVKRLGLI